jgi:hypothetical protein
MIFHNPPDKLLRTADIVALFDPHRPGWHEVVVNLLGVEACTPKDFLVVDIPVNSREPNVVEDWRKRVLEVRS